VRKTPGPPPVAENRLLVSLSKRRYRGLFSALKPAAFSLGQVLYEPGDPVRYAVFPSTAMLSVVAAREDDGRSVEIAVVGSDGMLGLPAFLGHPTTPYQIITQLPGAALRAPVAVVREAAAKAGAFRDAIQTYTLAPLVELSRSAVCVSFHSLDQRLARWILVTHDHARADVFPMKQEFMSKMLAQRRVSVTQAAHRLRRTGAIEYRRGEVTVLDRGALEAISCECYRVVREAFAPLHRN
jgi:CRP-like cAMP-binding protein